MRHVRGPLWLAALATLLLGVAGCGVSETTVRLAATKVAAIEAQSPATTNFGVCFPGLLDRRGTGGFFWNEFLRLESTDRRYGGDALAGFEVLISRGETCHLRIVHEYQAAVEFDLSSLPSRSVALAELVFSGERNGGLDAPAVLGSSEQCGVLRIREATEVWTAGYYPDDAPVRERRSFIAARPIAYRPPGPLANPYGSYDVTRTVRAWAQGDAPNFGFVIMPDRDETSAVAGEIEEEREQILCPLLLGDFELVVTVLTRGS